MFRSVHLDQINKRVLVTPSCKKNPLSKGGQSVDRLAFSTAYLMTSLRGGTEDETSEVKIMEMNKKKILKRVRKSLARTRHMRGLLASIPSLAAFEFSSSRVERFLRPSGEELLFESCRLFNDKVGLTFTRLSTNNNSKWTLVNLYCAIKDLPHSQPLAAGLGLVFTASSCSDLLNITASSASVVAQAETICGTTPDVSATSKCSLRHTLLTSAPSSASRTEKRRRVDEVTIGGIVFSSSCALKEQDSEQEIEIAIESGGLVLKKISCDAGTSITVNAQLKAVSSLRLEALAGEDICEVMSKRLSPKIMCYSFNDEVARFGSQQKFSLTSLFEPEKEFCALTGLNGSSVKFNTATWEIESVDCVSPYSHVDVNALSALAERIRSSSLISTARQFFLGFTNLGAAASSDPDIIQTILDPRCLALRIDPSIAFGFNQVCTLV